MDGQIFIKIEKHDEIKQMLADIKIKSDSARAKLQKIREMENQEASSLEDFEQSLKKIEMGLAQVKEYLSAVK